MVSPWEKQKKRVPLGDVLVHVIKLHVSNCPLYAIRQK